MDYTEIRVDVADGVQTITLNRPERLNAFTGTMCVELIEAYKQADADDDVRAVVVTGEGRGFCAGADLGGGGDTFDASARGDAEASDHRDGGGLVVLQTFECTKPVIGAINGPAVGVGATMTLPYDVRLISSEAKMGFVFARRGITPEACSSWFLPRIVGISRAMEWVASGRVFLPDEALEAGLVREICAPDALLPRAYELAREMTAHTAPVSVALSRRMLWHGLGMSHPMEAHRADSRAIFSRGQSADTREGVMSFLEKRDAVFPDKVSDGLPDIGLTTPAF